MMDSSRLTGVSIIFLLVTLKVGCDGVLGSDKRTDTCGICGGDNTSCHIISGIFTRVNLPYGYSKVTTIPKGSCNINITEMIQYSPNYLAMKLTSGDYILNGNYALGYSNDYEGGGTIIEYHRPLSGDVENPREYILAKGPTNTSLDVMVLKQQPNRGVIYSYTIPMSKAHPQKGTEHHGHESTDTPTKRKGRHHGRQHHKKQNRFVNQQDYAKELNTNPRAASESLPDTAQPQSHELQQDQQNTQNQRYQAYLERQKRQRQKGARSLIDQLADGSYGHQRPDPNSLTSALTSGASRRSEVQSPTPVPAPPQVATVATPKRSSREDAYQERLRQYRQRQKEAQQREQERLRQYEERRQRQIKERERQIQERELLQEQRRKQIEDRQQSENQQRQHQHRHRHQQQLPKEAAQDNDEQEPEVPQYGKGSNPDSTPDQQQRHTEKQAPALPQPRQDNHQQELLRRQQQQQQKEEQLKRQQELQQLQQQRQLQQQQLQEQLKKQEELKKQQEEQQRQWQLRQQQLQKKPDSQPSLQQGSGQQQRPSGSSSSSASSSSSSSSSSSAAAAASSLPSSSSSSSASRPTSRVTSTNRTKLKGVPGPNFGVQSPAVLPGYTGQGYNYGASGPAAGRPQSGALLPNAYPQSQSGVNYGVRPQPQPPQQLQPQPQPGPNYGIRQPQVGLNYGAGHPPQQVQAQPGLNYGIGGQVQAQPGYNYGMRGQPQQPQAQPGFNYGIGGQAQQSGLPYGVGGVGVGLGSRPYGTQPGVPYGQIPPAGHQPLQHPIPGYVGQVVPGQPVPMQPYVPPQQASNAGYVAPGNYQRQPIQLPQNRQNPNPYYKHQQLAPPQSGTQPLYGRAINDQIRLQRPAANRGGGKVNRDPIDDYTWRIAGFSACSRTCGGGQQDTSVICVKGSSQAIVTDDNCDSTIKPQVQSVVCNTGPCPPGWDVGEWADCSTSCDRGQQTRIVECKQRVSEQVQIHLSATRCQSVPKPEPARVCNEAKPCVSWRVGDWDKCSVECGRGQRQREVVCVNYEDRPIPENSCNPPKPRGVEICDMGSCAKTWFYSRWSQECSSNCGEGVYTRRTFCSADVERCTAISKPKAEKLCKSDLPCGGQWFTGPLSKCTVTCGDGVAKQEIVCMKKLGGLMAVVGEENCQQGERPQTDQPCHRPACVAEWYMTDWTECSASCNTGFRSREVKCLDQEQSPTNTCDVDTRPESRQPCNTLSCPTVVTDPHCKDKFKNCRLVVQARLCKYAYYKSICCFSCINHEHHHHNHDDQT